MSYVSKLIEQSLFSGIAFLCIFLSGYLLSAEQFYLFSYGFTTLQALVLLYFSYISTSFFVFYSKQQNYNYFSQALMVLFVVHLLLLLPFVFYFYVKLSSMLMALLCWLLVVLWCMLDLVRKVYFIDASKKLVLPSLTVICAFIVFLGTATVLDEMTALSIYFALTSAMLIAVIMFIRPIPLPYSYEQTGRYARKNHNFAIWNAYSAFVTWGLTGGLLLLFEPYMTQQQFNACRILLSFIGLSNLITTVIENNLVVKLNNDPHMLQPRVWLKYLALSLLLSLLVAGVSYIGFLLFYKHYLAEFYQAAPILAVNVFFTLNKPMIAYLKVNDRSRWIFYALALAAIVSAAVAYFCLSLGGITALSAAMIAGTAVLSAALVGFYLTAQSEFK